MKYLIPLIFAILSGSGLMAQGTEPDTTYWNVSLYGSADYNYRFLSGSSGPGQDKAFFDGIEKPRIGWIGGVSVQRQLRGRLSIQFGISFQSQGYRTLGLSDTVFNYRDSALYNTLYDKATRYMSVNIPVILKINMFHIGKAAFDFGIGLSPSFSMGKHQVSFFSDHTEYYNSRSENSIDLQALACLSIYVPVSRYLSFTFEPTFRYNILPYEDKYYSGIKRNMFSAGLGIYFTYKVTDNKMYDYYYEKIYNKSPIPAF